MNIYFNLRIHHVDICNELVSTTCSREGGSGKEEIVLEWTTLRGTLYSDEVLVFLHAFGVQPCDAIFDERPMLNNEKREKLLSLYV